jgi:hypothetical protein
MEIVIDMPMIRNCDVSACTYNINAACHAKAITIGDGVTPGCDTFMQGGGHVRSKQITAGVGACKVGGCSFNADFECSAESIDVSHQGGNVLCMTFMPR